jgi:hypothetical protein
MDTENILENNLENHRPDRGIVIIPLKYNLFDDYSNFKNIILIDDKVINNIEFFNYVNQNTFPILYNITSTATELEELLQKFTSIERLCFVFDELCLYSNKSFLNRGYFFKESDLNETETYSDNFNLIVNAIKRLNIKNVDYLACNSLNYSEWVKYYEKLKDITNVVVGASNDKTGNLKYGGDWVLESTGLNIESTYFTEDIKNYAYTLSAASVTVNGGETIYIQQVSPTSTVQYKVNNNGNWIDIDFTNGLQLIEILLLEL